MSAIWGPTMMPRISSTTTTGMVSFGAASITSRPAKAADATMTSREVSSMGASTTPSSGPSIDRGLYETGRATRASSHLGATPLARGWEGVPVAHPGASLSVAARLDRDQDPEQDGDDRHDRQGGQRRRRRQQRDQEHRQRDASLVDRLHMPEAER